MEIGLKACLAAQGIQESHPDYWIPDTKLASNLNDMASG